MFSLIAWLIITLLMFADHETWVWSYLNRPFRLVKPLKVDLPLYAGSHRASITAVIGYMCYQLDEMQSAPYFFGFTLILGLIVTIFRAKQSQNANPKE